MMVLLTNSISPHQLPLARELVARLGAENFRYIYTEQCGLSAERRKLGWGTENDSWLVPASDSSSQACIENADILICSFRDPALIERRCKKNLRTYYTNERWFKPPIGRLRMLVPSFRRMTKRMVSLCRQYDCFRMLPIGVHAYNDYKWAGVPESKMTTWGYFVAPSDKKDDSTLQLQLPTTTKPLRVLWVGRMLKLKNVDVIIKAFQSLDSEKFELTLVGAGPERERLIRMAQGMDNVYFRDSVPIEKVRELMRAHDVFVFPSNGYDGWGAVVSEALEEGMQVLGSNQAGASATILPPSHRFDCGDWRRLAELLTLVKVGRLESVGIGQWTVQKAADALLSRGGRL